MALFRKDSRALDALFADAEGIDPTKIVEKQMTGHMYKCSIDGSRRWKRRFFVLKDGFLLYYEPRDKPLVFFDFHPKGVLPLDGADIQALELTDGPKVDGQRAAFGIDITHSSFGGRALSLAVETEAMRNTWVAAMEASRHVTYKNAVTGSTSVDMYKDMATHAQERMSKLSAQLIAAKKEIKALKAANADKNEHLVAVLTAVATASSTHGIKIPLPTAPTSAAGSDSEDEAAEPRTGTAVSTPEQPASGAGPTLAERRGVRFEPEGGSAAGEGGDEDEGAQLSLSITDTEDVQTAGSMKPQHGGSPGRTPAPRQAMEQMGFSLDDEEDGEAEHGTAPPSEKKALSFEGEGNGDGDAADGAAAESAVTPPAQGEEAPPAQEDDAPRTASTGTNPFA